MDDWLDPKMRTAAGFLLLVLLLTWETVAPCFGFFLKHARERARHGLRNLALGMLNATFTSVVFVGLWWQAAAWAGTHQFGLLNWAELPSWSRVVAALLLFDAWMYWWHRLNHQVPLLWRFHRTHHSDPLMDVTTATRFHVGEIALSGCLRVPVVWLLGLRISELAVYELVMFAVVQTHHANIAFPGWLDRALRGFLVTPFMHKVHHSRWRPETDSNYSSLFSFWDRIFGTFRRRDDFRTLRFGLEEFERPSDQTLAGLLATPLRPGSRDDPAASAGPPPSRKP